MLISHEWIAPVGGSENVFCELLDIFPRAVGAALWNDDAARFDRPIRESILAASVLRGRKAVALPLMPVAWRAFDLAEFDTVLSSSHAFGHHLASRAARLDKHAFCYVHTPARYVWAPQIEVRGRGLPVRLASSILRPLDRIATHPRVNYAANSQYVRQRILSAWGREASVIYPPVDVEAIQSRHRWAEVLDDRESELVSGLPDSFVLGASRLVAYKRLDRAIAVGEQLGLPVVIAGSGPAEDELRVLAAKAAQPVHFVGRVSNSLLYALYQAASIFVFMPVEDFGIMPVEAIAAGTPVLVSTDGGASESVTATGGGVALPPGSTACDLRQSAKAALALDMNDATRLVRSFSREAFRDRVLAWIQEAG